MHAPLRALARVCSCAWPPPAGSPAASGGSAAGSAAPPPELYALGAALRLACRGGAPPTLDSESGDLVGAIKALIATLRAGASGGGAPGGSAQVAAGERAAEDPALKAALELLESPALLRALLVGRGAGDAGSSGRGPADRGGGVADIVDMYWPMVAVRQPRAGQAPYHRLSEPSLSTPRGLLRTTPSVTALTPALPLAAQAAGRFGEEGGHAGAVHANVRVLNTLAFSQELLQELWRWLSPTVPVRLAGVAPRHSPPRASRSGVPEWILTGVARRPPRRPLSARCPRSSPWRTPAPAPAAASGCPRPSPAASPPSARTASPPSASSPRPTTTCCSSSTTTSSTRSRGPSRSPSSAPSQRR